MFRADRESMIATSLYAYNILMTRRGGIAGMVSGLFGKVRLLSALITA